MNPAVEWLHNRLERASATPQEVQDEASTLGITESELASAIQTLKVTEEWRRPESGGDLYAILTLSPQSRDALSKAIRLRPASEVVTTPPPPPIKQKKDPKTAVQKAKARLQRHAPRTARYLDALTQRVMDEDGVKCPTCGRGTLRSEELRLKAILASLDRAGVTAPRGAGEDPGDPGAAIVFPPGTRIAIMADTPPSGGVPEGRAIHMTRADQL